MANSKQILAKIARDAAMLGLTVNSQSQSAVVIENGTNDLTVSYVDASIQSPMGGVSDAASPFLGIGVANPGKLSMKSQTGTTVGTTIDSADAAKLLALLAGFANDIAIMHNNGTTELAAIRGSADLLGMGQ